VVKNPVVRAADGAVDADQYGQVRLQHAETEVRLEQEPFPLYPGEELDTPVRPLTTVLALTALRLRVTRDFVDGETRRVAGDEFLFEGPGTYIPRKEVEVEATERAVVIKPNEALKLRAKRDTVDRDGEWRQVTSCSRLLIAISSWFSVQFKAMYCKTRSYQISQSQSSVKLSV
jgi:major vault protein